MREWQVPIAVEHCPSAGCSPLFALKMSVEGWQRNTGGKAVGGPSWSLQSHQNCCRNRKIVSPARNEGARRSEYAGKRPGGRSLLHKNPHCPDQTRAPSRQWQKNGNFRTSNCGAIHLDSPVRADGANDLDKLGLVISCGCRPIDHNVTPVRPLEVYEPRASRWLLHLTYDGDCLSHSLHDKTLSAPGLPLPCPAAFSHRHDSLICKHPSVNHSQTV